MNTYSPKRKIQKPTPLNLLQKSSPEEEEPLIFEENSKEIKFNELLILHSLQFWINNTKLSSRYRILKCKGLQNIGWMNPCLDSENILTSQNKRSILKQTYNRRLQ